MASSLEAASPYVAEFIGTFMLVFTVGCCCLTGSALWNATAIASVLMVMVYTYGPVSGGHLNPAVSLAIGLAGKEKWDTVAKYVVTQLLAGIVAGVVFTAMVGYGSTPSYVDLRPAAPFEWGHAMAVEVIYTAMLCFVVLNVACSKKNNPADDQNQFFALAIGFVIVAGGYAAGGISGACFNPAVSLGLEVSRFEAGMNLAWPLYYAIWQCLGACVAVGLFQVCRADDDKDAVAPALPAKLLSEFLGTFMLVFTVGLNVVNKSPAVAWSAAASLMCMIYALGSVSGAHFNPAVTTAIMLSGRNVCSAMHGCFYILAQLVGGLCAGAATSVFHAAGPNNSVAFGLAPGATYTDAQAGLAELAFTFVLAYVVLAVATVAPPVSWTQQNFQFGLAIGSCVTAGGFAIGAISGGEMNPAVSLGIATSDVMHRGLADNASVIYFFKFLAYEVAGGALAAIVLRLTHPKEFLQK